jgi:hypothetical protein
MRDVPTDVDFAANMYTGIRIRTNNIRKMTTAVASTKGTGSPVTNRCSHVGADTTRFHCVAESRYSIWKLVIHIRPERARGADVVTSLSLDRTCTRACTFVHKTRQCLRTHFARTSASISPCVPITPTCRVHIFFRVVLTRLVVLH